MGMSKTKEKKSERLREHAEYVWEQAQLRAAMAKTQLDIAIQVFKDMNGEMTAEQIAATEEQIALKEKELEDYLMSSRDTYIKRLAELDGTSA
jgi:ERCC4-type nuclease